MAEAVFDPVARLYDHEQQDYVKDIPFYVECARECGGEVLEIACGTGRVLMPIAAQGIRITGLDISAGMLNVCRSKVDADPRVRPNVTLVQADMAHFDLGRKFAMIYVAFRSFQCLLTQEDRVRCLGRVHKHLATNGKFVLDLFAPRHDYLAETKRKIDLGTFHDATIGADVSVRTEDVFDLARQTLHEDRYYEWRDKNGEPHRQVWSFDLGYLFRNEAELLLEKCGFEIEAVYGDFDRRPYDYYSGEQIFVARRTPGAG